MTAVAQAPVSALINGEPARCVDFSDRGLHYGDGVFTTLAVRQGLPLLLDRHLARLQADAGRLGLPFPGRQVLADEIRQLCAASTDAVLKLILTRGTGGRGYRCPENTTGTRILSVHPKPDYPPDLAVAGVRARLCGLRLGINPRLAGVKHLNRLEQIMARAEWADDSIREGLLLDYEGFLVEGVMSNVFLLRQGRLRTPLLDRCGVAGVMRGWVLELAQDLGLVAEEARILPSELDDAEELFLTNSVIGIWPVCELEGRRFPIGPLAKLLAGQIDAAIAEALACR